LRSRWITKFLLFAAVSLQAENNLTVSADFLAWFASQEPASIWTGVITTKPNRAVWALPGFDFPWDYGFRIGAGYALPHDQWDTALSWSWFRTEAAHRIPSQPSALIQPEFDAGFLSGANPQSMSARWSLLFNVFDWELGRKYSVGKDIFVQPFLGVKGGWIHQSIEAKYNDLVLLVIFPTTNFGKEHLENHFWGVGPSAGVNTQWNVGNFFSLLGDFSTATMWGVWTCNDVYRNTLSQSYSVDTGNSPLGALMFRGFLGMGWKSKSRFAAKLGYETQVWLNQLRISTFQLQRLHHDLTLQGITLNAQLDF